MAPAIMAPDRTATISTRITIIVAIPAVAALAVPVLHFPMVPTMY